MLYAAWRHYDNRVFDPTCVIGEVVQGVEFKKYDQMDCVIYFPVYFKYQQLQ